MSELLTEHPETATLAPGDLPLAADTSRQLSQLLPPGDGPVTLHVESNGRREPLTIPRPAVRLIVAALAHLARGEAVTLVPSRMELTTQQAADLLNVSRPFVAQLIDANELPYRTVGSRRRVRYEDVMAYKARVDRARLDTLAELAAESQALGLGY